MAELVYRGGPPVGAAETQALLLGPFKAIWSPPMYRHATPSPGDRLWLLWQSDGDSAVLVGNGFIRFTDEGTPYWTNRTAPGVAEAAKSLGYPGPRNMGFLRLTDVRIAPDLPKVPKLGRVRVGLTVASPEQAAVLRELPSSADRPSSADEPAGTIEPSGGAMAQSDWINAQGILVNLAAVRVLDHRPSESSPNLFEVVADEQVGWTGSREGALRIIDQLAVQLGAIDLDALVELDDE